METLLLAALAAGVAFIMGVVVGAMLTANGQDDLPPKHIHKDGY